MILSNKYSIIIESKQCTYIIAIHITFLLYMYMTSVFYFQYNYGVAWLYMHECNFTNVHIYFVIISVKLKALVMSS